MNESNFNVDFRINLELMESNRSAYFTQKERINRKRIIILLISECYVTFFFSL